MVRHLTRVGTPRCVTLRPIVPQLTCITNIRTAPYLAKKLASATQVRLCPNLLVYTNTYANYKKLKEGGEI